MKYDANETNEFPYPKSSPLLIPNKISFLLIFNNLSNVIPRLNGRPDRNFLILILVFPSEYFFGEMFYKRIISCVLSNASFGVVLSTLLGGSIVKRRD